MTVTSVKRKYEKAIISCGDINQGLQDFEGTIVRRKFPLGKWKDEEHSWKAVVTSKEASDNPRILKRLQNPYEPAEEIGKCCCSCYNKVLNIGDQRHQKNKSLHL